MTARSTSRNGLVRAGGRTPAGSSAGRVRRIESALDRREGERARSAAARTSATHSSSYRRRGRYRTTRRSAGRRGTRLPTWRARAERLERRDQRADDRVAGEGTRLFMRLMVATRPVFARRILAAGAVAAATQSPAAERRCRGDRTRCGEQPLRASMPRPMANGPRRSCLSARPPWTPSVIITAAPMNVITVPRTRSRRGPCAGPQLPGGARVERGRISRPFSARVIRSRCKRSCVRCRSTMAMTAIQKRLRIIASGRAAA